MREISSRAEGAPYHEICLPLQVDSRVLKVWLIRLQIQSVGWFGGVGVRPRQHQPQTRRDSGTRKSRILKPWRCWYARLSKCQVIVHLKKETERCSEELKWLEADVKFCNLGFERFLLLLLKDFQLASVPAKSAVRHRKLQPSHYIVETKVLGIMYY